MQVFLFALFCLLKMYSLCAVQTLRALSVGNTVLTVFFTLECILMMTALGPRIYFSEGFNKFDFVVVVCSLAELISNVVVGASGGSLLSSLRGLRLLRVLKLARKIKSLQVLLFAVAESFKPVVLDMGLLLFLYLFMFGVLGMQLFAGKFATLDPPPLTQSNFDDLYFAMLAVLQIMTSDDWISLLSDMTRAGSFATALIYALVAHAFGAYLLMTIYIAIIIEKFGAMDDDAFHKLDIQDYVVQAVGDTAAKEYQTQVLPAPICSFSLLTYKLTFLAFHRSCRLVG